MDDPNVMDLVSIALRIGIEVFNYKWCLFLIWYEFVVSASYCFTKPSAKLVEVESCFHSFSSKRTKTGRAKKVTIRPGRRLF